MSLYISTFGARPMRSRKRLPRVPVVVGAVLIAALTACGSTTQHGGHDGSAVPVATARVVSGQQRSQVLHYYLRNVSMSFVTSTGAPFTPSPSDPPKPGYVQERTDLLYAGDTARHAATWSASDHQRCVFDEQGDAVCQAEVAVGGSMILASVTLSDPTAAVTETVTGGVGSYVGVSGTAVFVRSATAPTDGDLTITLHHD
ncbi:MAG TPA: hypothetical protein VFR11_09060 [Micromonosporaceae bacterium]|jgi:hypothetical protein|nr:hypothetical protein [Micromonosporaceae bacterium]